VNRALDGDIIALELIDGPAENGSSDGSIDAPAATGEGVISSNTAEAEAYQIEALPQPEKPSALAPSDGQFGRVVGIIKRNWRQYAGSLVPVDEVAPAAAAAHLPSEEEYDGDEVPSERALFIPQDSRLPRVEISTRRLAELLPCRVLVSVDCWPSYSPHPLGHFVRSFGASGSKSVETAVLLHEYEVPHEAFSPAVMACLPPADWKITEEVVAARTDLRHLPVVSIDPPGCKDIDDALHCRRLPDGTLEVGVHIADVGYFVEPGSALDQEAQHRSTSTYLVDRRLDMLPGYLTTQLCSLRSHEDHLAFSVIWIMDDDANIIDVSFCKSAIHSVASMTYDEAQVCCSCCFFNMALVIIFCA
jgi:exosome complex exonuclease DIS3/RRP44